MKGLAIALVASVVLLAGCKKTPRPDIPVYPDARGIQGQGTIKLSGATLFNNNWVTVAEGYEVRKFYEDALLQRPGWTKSGNPTEHLVFTDGNMTSQDGRLYSPTDETKPGGLVEITIGGNQTLFQIWQSVPTPPK